MEYNPSREDALALLHQYNQQDSLIRHGLAVEAVMRHFARKAGEDPEKWNTHSFAAGANREVIARGAEMLEMKIEELVDETIAAMQARAAEIGLIGNLWSSFPDVLPGKHSHRQAQHV